MINLLFNDAGSYNVTGISSLMSYTNYLTDYLLGAILLIGLFFLIIITSIGKTQKESTPFVIAGFICSITAILFRAMDILNDTWLFGVFILSVIFYAWSYFEK